MSLKNLGSVTQSVELLNEQLRHIKSGESNTLWFDGLRESLKGVSSETIMTSASMLKLNANQIACLLSANKLSASEIAAKLATEGYSASVTETALRTAQFSDANIKAAISTTTFKATTDAATASTVTFGATVKKVFTGIVAWIMTNPIATTLIAVTAATIGLVAAIDHYNKAAERAKENLKELQDEFSSNAEELKTLESELKGVTDRISELDGKTLTITEAEELQNLQAQNNELSRQIELLKLRQEIKQQQVNDAFVDTMNKDLYRRDYSTFDSTGSAIQITEAEHIDNQFRNYEDTLSQLTELDAKFQEDLADAQKNNDEKRIKKLEVQYDEDKQRLEDAQAEILTYLSGKQVQFSEALSGVSYTEETAELFDFVKDFEDRLLILRGDDSARTNAFNRLVDGEFKETTAELRELGKQGKVTASDLNDPAYSDFIQKLVSLGVITDTTDDSLAFVAAGFNSLATAEAAATAGTRDFESVMTTVTESVDTVQEKISTLSGALSSLQDGTLKASEVVDLLQEFPELAPYVDLTADGFGNLNDGLKEMIKNAPTKLIDTLEDFKRTNDLTDEAADSVDNLIDYLTDMPVYAIDDVTDAYGLMEEAIIGAKRAASELDDILSGPDHDDLFKADIEYFEKLEELLKEGKVGTKKFQELSKHFVGEDSSVEEVKAWVKKNKKIYTEDGSGIYEFLKEVQKLSADGGALQGIMEYDGKNFWYDNTRLDEAATILKRSEESLTGLIGGVRAVSENWTDSVESMYSEFSAAEGEYVRRLSDGRIVAHLEDIMMYFKMSKDEALAFADEVKAAGLANLQIIDDAALKDWSGFADSTNRNVAEINALSQALKEAGMSTADINNYVHGNWAQLASNFDSAIRPVLEELQWSQGEIDSLYAKITNIPAAIGDAADLSKTEFKVVVDGEEIGLAIGSTDQLEQVLEDLPDDTTLTIIDDTGEVRSGLRITKELLEDIAKNKYQKVTIDYVVSGTSIKDYGASESHDNSAYHSSASGTDSAKRGLTLLGDEYSPDGSPKPELVVSDGYAYVAGANGPEIKYLNDGDQVYPADKTKKILNDVNRGGFRIPAHAAGAAYDSSFVGSAVDLSTQEKLIEYQKEQIKLNEQIAKEQERLTKTSSKVYLNTGHDTGTKGTPKKGGAGSKSGSGSSSSSSSSKSESEFEKLYKKHQHLVNIEQETDREYLDWLEDAYKEAYKKGQIELDDYRKYEEEVFQLRREIFSDSLNDIEHQIKALENSDGSPSAIVALYDDMVKKIEKQLAAAYKSGLDDNDSYVQELQSQLWDYQSEVKDIQEEITENAEDAIEELVDLRIDMIKQDLENEKEALDKKLDYLQDFYQKQKDLLQDAYDEDKYLEEQTEKRKAITDIEFELAQLEYDNSAWAQKRKLELLDELTSAKKELTDFEKEHALQSAQEELDAQLALHEKEIEAEQLLIDEKLNNAKALYEQALADVRNGSVALYEEMIAYNAKYGSGIDEDIKKAWETAYVALEDYFDLYDERYKGIKLDNATEYEKPKTETPKDKASESTKDKSASESKKDTSSKDSSNDKKKKNTPSLAKGSSITVKKSATHFGSKSGGKKMASFVPGGKYTVYKTSGNQVLIGKNGEYTGWIKKSDIVGYKSGTDYSIAGLAQFDEEGKGSEYIFESTNGNRYRMFGEGSKVLNADATNFLYDFATSGGSVLAKMFSDAFNAVNLNNIAKPAQTIQLAAGDIIIQGNASQRTVSEIRRAQRENLEFVLKSLNSLNK